MEAQDAHNTCNKRYILQHDRNLHFLSVKHHHNTCWSFWHGKEIIDILMWKDDFTPNHRGWLHTQPERMTSHPLVLYTQSTTKVISGWHPHIKPLSKNCPLLQICLIIFVLFLITLKIVCFLVCCSFVVATVVTLLIIPLSKKISAGHWPSVGKYFLFTDFDVKQKYKQNQICKTDKKKAPQLKMNITTLFETFLEAPPTKKQNQVWVRNIVFFSPLWYFFSLWKSIGLSLILVDQRGVSPLGCFSYGQPARLTLVFTVHRHTGFCEWAKNNNKYNKLACETKL